MFISKLATNIKVNIPGGSILSVHKNTSIFYTTSIEDTTAPYTGFPCVLSLPVGSKIYVIKYIGKHSRHSRDKLLSKYLCMFNDKPYYLLFDEQEICNNVSIFPLSNKNEKNTNNKCQIGSWLTNKQYKVYGCQFKNIKKLLCTSGTYKQKLLSRNKSEGRDAVYLRNDYYNEDTVVGKNIEVCPGKHCLIFNFYLKGNLYHWEFHDRSGKKDYKQFTDHWRRVYSV